jgi:hypothetical protein
MVDYFKGYLVIFYVFRFMFLVLLVFNFEFFVLNFHGTDSYGTDCTD